MPEVVSLGLTALTIFFSIKLPNLLFCVRYDLVGWYTKSWLLCKKKESTHIVKGLFLRIYAQKTNTGVRQGVFHELLLNVVLLDGGFRSRGQSTRLTALTSVQMVQGAAAKVRRVYEFRFLEWFTFGFLGLIFTVMAKGICSIASRSIC